ncbi:MAG: sulfite exporter TauE/SafE family protein [Clostridiales bacterium]|nr:sulfite exporter TauE/SafE family protein [Clostridiales bacterium]
MSNELLLMIIVFSVIFIAGCVQGMTSFGFSLLSLPILSMIIDIKVIVPMLVIFSLIMNSIILYKIRKHMKLKDIYLLIVVAALATPLGAKLLINVDKEVLQVFVGILVTLSAILLHYGYKINIKNEKLVHIPLGFMSGLLNGSVSLSGPPVILFLTNQGVDKQVFRATLTAFFWILNIITIVTFYFNNLITGEVVQMTSITVPALVAGVLLGVYFGNKVKDQIFKKITTIMIISMGMLSIITAIA